MMFRVEGRLQAIFAWALVVIPIALDRQANAALWRIVMTRIVYDPRTKRYINRRMREGLTKKEAMRCLKRYVAREVFAALPREDQI